VSALAELMVRIHSPPAGSLRTIARDGRGRRRKCRSEIKTTEFDGNLWPPEPSLEGFREFITQEARYLETFWHQFGNSFFIGLLTMVLTGAMTSKCQLIAHVSSPATARSSKAGRIFVTLPFVPTGHGAGSPAPSAETRPTSALASGESESQAIT